MGGLSAACEACRSPGGIAGLVLVAPAIIAKGTPGEVLEAVANWSGQLEPLGDPGQQQDGAVSSKSRRSGGGSSGSGSGSSGGPATAPAAAAPSPPFRRYRSVALLPDRYSTRAVEPAGVGGGGARPGSGSGSTIVAGVWAPVVRLVALLRVLALLGLLLVLRLLQPAIVLLLRGMVRSRKFWVRGLQNAYYDPDKVGWWAPVSFSCVHGDWAVPPRAVHPWGSTPPWAVHPLRRAWLCFRWAIILPASLIHAHVAPLFVWACPAFGGRCPCRSLGFRCRSLGFRCRSLGFRCRSLGFRCRSLGFRCRSLGFRCRSLGFRVLGFLGFRCRSLGFRGRCRA